MHKIADAADYKIFTLCFYFMSDTKSIKNSLISKCSVTVLCLVLVSLAEFNFVLVSAQ